MEEEILQDSLLISILCDESTDIAIAKQLVVYVRYVKDGKIDTRFLKIHELFDGKQLKHLFLKFYLSSRFLCKIGAFGSDGAAVMVGRRNSVATNLTDRIPHLVAIHCVAHSLALATAHASDCIKKYSITLQTIYYFFQNSSVRMAHLQWETIASNSRSLNMFVGFHMGKLFQLLGDVYKQEAVNNPTAAGLVKAVTTYEFVACTFLFSDILPSLNRLSLTFQRKDTDFSVI